MGQNYKFIIGLITIVNALFYGCNNNNEVKVKPPVKNIEFYVAGHVYGAPGIQNFPFHPPFQKYFNSTLNDSTINFAFLTGDIVQESDDASWHCVDSLIKLAPYKVYFAAGNHDLKNRKLYENRYGNTNYHFVKENNLFVVWDVLDSGWNITDEQISELEQLTIENNFDNIFIFSHHIFWFDLIHTPQIKLNSTYGKLDQLSFYSTRIHQLNDLKIPIYIFGGDVGAVIGGSYSALHQFENIHFICSGMGGGEWDNIMKVQVTDRKASLKIHYLNNIPELNIDTLYNPIWL